MATQEDPVAFILRWLKEGGFLKSKDAFVIDDALGSIRALFRRLEPMHERLFHYCERVSERFNTALREAGEQGRRELLREMFLRYGPEVADPAIVMKELVDAAAKFHVPPIVDVNLN